MYISVEASLKKLRTNYIDLLYLHWWDWDTSIEEVMKSLHSLVVQGKVLYLVSHDCYWYIIDIILFLIMWNREFQTHRHGSCRKPINTPVTMR